MMILPRLRCLLMGQQRPFRFWILMSGFFVASAPFLIRINFRFVASDMMHGGNYKKSLPVRLMLSSLTLRIPRPASRFLFRGPLKPWIRQTLPGEYTVATGTAIGQRSDSCPFTRFLGTPD